MGGLSEQRRRTLLVWLVGLAVLIGVAWLLAEAGTHDAPDGVVETGSTPTLPTVAWAWLWLSVLWTIALWFSRMTRAVRERSPSATGFRVADSVLGLVLLLLPLVFISGCSLYLTMSPGCGEPRAGLLLPLPPGVDRLHESTEHGPSGAWRLRTLIVASNGGTENELVDDLVDHYRARGWSLEESPGGTGAFGSAAEWHLSIRETLGGEEAGPGEATIDLSHDPTDHRGCITL